MVHFSGIIVLPYVKEEAISKVMNESIANVDHLLKISDEAAIGLS